MGKDGLLSKDQTILHYIPGTWRLNLAGIILVMITLCQDTGTVCLLTSTLTLPICLDVKPTHMESGKHQIYSIKL